jgi:hypothetical protein
MEPFTKALLERAKGLVGNVLIGVRYYDGAPETLEEVRRDVTVAHSGLLGVELVTDRQVVAVISSNELTDGTSELSLLERPAPDRLGVVDVTSKGDEWPWAPLIGQKIVVSKIHWVASPYIALAKRRRAFSSHHFDVDGAVPFSGPQAPLALELHGEGGGRILIVAGGWSGVDQPIVETESGVTVLWDATTFATLVPRIAKELKRSWS